MVTELSESQVAAAMDSGATLELRTVDLEPLGKYRVASQDFTEPEDTVLLVGQSLEDVERTTRTLLWLFLGAGALGVLIASALGTVLVKRALRPLETLRSAAASVSETPLTSGSASLPVRVSDQEFESGSGPSVSARRPRPS